MILPDRKHRKNSILRVFYPSVFDATYVPTYASIKTLYTNKMGKENYSRKRNDQLLSKDKSIRQC